MDPLELLSGDAQAFLKEVWASRALIHKSDAVQLTGLLSLDDVDALLTSTAIRTPALRVAQDGKVLPSTAYTRQATIAGVSVTGLIDARKLIALFESGATLVLQGVHRYWPPLTEMIRELERRLGHPCQANAYLTPPGAQGFALHSDTHDVFVFQTHGAKLWEVHDRGAELDVLMEVGTSMYLPAGTPHAARTQDTASLHVTIGINQLSYRDALRHVVDQVLDDAEFGDRLPAGYLDDPSSLASGLGTHVDALVDRLKKLDSTTMATGQARRLLTSRSPVLRGGITDALSAGHIDDETVVTRRAGALCVVQPPAEGDSHLTLLLADRELRIPAHLADVSSHLASLVPGQELRPADLADWLDPQSRVVLTRRLVREGFLRVAA